MPVRGISAMEPQTARAAVRALAEQTDEDLVVYAWGGEPTQNPGSLLAMVEEAQSFAHVKVLVISNGVVNPDLLDQLLQFDNVVYQISFDGLVSEDSQKLLATNQGSLEHVLRTLDAISRVSKRLSLRATATRANIEELGQTLTGVTRRYTNRLVVEHLHTYNGRALGLADEAPDIDAYVDLVFGLVREAEAQGVHVKALPLDHLRAGGPNDKMNFLNVLPGGQVTVSNAIIYAGHPDFQDLHIGDLVGDHIVFDQETNTVLARRYLDNYAEQCGDCFARSVCRGSVQRYLFITNDALGNWDDRRCRYFRAVIARWLEEMARDISAFLSGRGEAEGLVKLIAPEGKIHYPMLVGPGGLALAHRPFDPAVE
jgi:sulfatase maturation enzyme AslB (radical SAM superfamily)